MKEKISIIVPIYNVEPYLRRCLTTVLEQSYKNWECILINDGSTDQSEVIAKEFVQKDNRFVLYSKKNGGLSSARNEGIKKATGKYVMFLDSDDALHTEILRYLYQAIKKDQSDVAVCNFIKFDEQIPKVSSLGRHYILNNKQAVNQIIKERRRYMITAWGKLYKRELFESITYPVGYLHEDEFVTYKIFVNCKKISVLDMPLYFYFQRQGSIMGTYQLERLRVLEAFKESILYLKKNMPELYEAAYANYMFNLAVADYRIHELQDGKELQKKIRQEFLKKYKVYQSLSNHALSKVKRYSLFLYRICPYMFYFGAKIYLNLNDD